MWMVHLKGPRNLGTRSKRGFIFLVGFSLGSDSQAAREENRRNLSGEEISFNSTSSGGSAEEEKKSWLLYFCKNKTLDEEGRSQHCKYLTQR